MNTDPRTAPTNDQRSTTDQLRDAVTLLNRAGLYDAADHCRRAVEDTERRMRTPGWMREVAAERSAEATEREARNARVYDAVSALKSWTNEDGRKFVFEDDLLTAMEFPGYPKETK
jgi:hypothetical protein